MAEVTTNCHARLARASADWPWHLGLGRCCWRWRRERVVVAMTAREGWDETIKGLYTTVGMLLSVKRCVKSNMASQAWWQARQVALLVQDT